VCVAYIVYTYNYYKLFSIQ